MAGTDGIDYIQTKLAKELPSNSQVYTIPDLSQIRPRLGQLGEAFLALRKSLSIAYYSHVFNDSFSTFPWTPLGFGSGNNGPIDYTILNLNWSADPLKCVVSAFPSVPFVAVVGYPTF